MGWEETNLSLHPATSILTSAKAISIVLSGSDKTDVRRENRDVR
jgi:hypothetical protein